MAVEQLILKIQPSDIAQFETFYSGSSNPLVVESLKNFFSSTETYIYLWGKTSSGKSHLLSAMCHEVERLNLQVAYFVLSPELSPELLENLEQYDLVCLDDIDNVLGNAAWETALFHLFNRIKDRGSKLLISGHAAPRELAINLADLKSRLSSGLIYQLSVLSDQEKLTALQQQAAARGLELSLEVGEFLLRRSQRDMKALSLILETLDRASLIEQRKLTIPFVKQVLGL